MDDMSVFDIIMMFVLIAILLVGVRQGSYKQGQIDYANGKIVYSLVKNTQGEMVWKRK